MSASCEMSRLTLIIHVDHHSISARLSPWIPGITVVIGTSVQVKVLKIKKTVMFAIQGLKGTMLRLRVGSSFD